MNEHTPRNPPKPLPEHKLLQREGTENPWERQDRLGEGKIREILAWAEDRLVDIYTAQALGGGEQDADYLDRIDDLFNTIRNAMTRQDLIKGLIINLHGEAARRSDRQKAFFDQTLHELMPGGITERRDQME